MRLSSSRSSGASEAAPARLGTFRADALAGLRATPKELPCKYFYDAAGAQLFERIAQLEEYYLTRTELGIMNRQAAEMAQLLGPQCLLIEYGSGSITKTRYLLDHLVEPAGYIPVDLSEEQLRYFARALAVDYSHLKVLPQCADFTRPLSLPTLDKPPARRVVYFPGSTIGNFTPEETIALLRQTAQLCGRGGGLLLGADLKKDPRVIEAAYNDVSGVTAQFNLNLLVRMNRELEADFQIERFWHHAFYTPLEGRIEMHLVSQRDQGIRIGVENIALAEGESIRTEFSYKYSLNNLRDLGTRAGFEVQRVWTDEHKLFAVLYCALG